VVIRFLFKAIRHAREYTAEHLEVKNLNRRVDLAERNSHLLALPGATTASRQSPRLA